MSISFCITSAPTASASNRAMNLMPFVVSCLSFSMVRISLPSSCASYSSSLLSPRRQRCAQPCISTSLSAILHSSSCRTVDPTGQANQFPCPLGILLGIELPGVELVFKLDQSHERRHFALRLLAILEQFLEIPAAPLGVGRHDEPHVKCGLGGDLHLDPRVLDKPRLACRPQGLDLVRFEHMVACPYQKIRGEIGFVCEANLDR